VLDLLALGLSTLTVPQSQTIIYMFVEGMTIEEIASERRCSERAIRNQRDRGLEKLRQWFEIRGMKFSDLI
jgi:DNA-directed RNA polymerase specialized sigma24 family protein